MVWRSRGANLSESIENIRQFWFCPAIITSSEELTPHAIRYKISDVDLYDLTFCGDTVRLVSLLSDRGSETSMQLVAAERGETYVYIICHAHRCIFAFRKLILV